MTGYFSIPLSRWNYPLSRIASKFFSLLAKYLFHAWLINGALSHRSKPVLSNACLCLKCKRVSFSMVMSIFHNQFWWQLSPTCQKCVALGVPRVKIHLLFCQVLCSWCIPGMVTGVYFHGRSIIQRGLVHLGAVQRRWFDTSTWALHFGSQSWLILWGTCTLNLESIFPWTCRLETQEVPWNL